jgi:poly(3-hydroxyalkanoate) synthetase
MPSGRILSSLLEWLPASPHTGNYGLEEYLLAISECIQRIGREGAKPVVMGHSFGGTLAAIYGCIAPATIRRLVILAAPLCFDHESDFRDVLIGLVPASMPAIGLYPGSLLSQMSAWASPRTFVWSRVADAALSFPDPHAMKVNARVERWTLDKIALPGKLVHQIVHWLYRGNRLCHNELRIEEKVVHPSNLSVSSSLGSTVHRSTAGKHSAFDQSAKRSGGISSASSRSGGPPSPSEHLARAHILAQIPELIGLDRVSKSREQIALGRS